MKIIRIIQNPIIKTVGIFVILYFALFANKENPESLGNRMSKENIKKNLGDVFRKGHDAMTTIETAGQEAQIEEGKKFKKFEEYEVSYVKSSAGKGDEKIDCADYVILTYKISDDENKVLTQRSENLTVGSGKSLLIERNILGMKVGETRNLIISQDYDGPDNLVREIVERYNRDIRYEITITNFNKNDIPQPYCKEE